MTAIFLVVCAFACPLSMLLMMWFMRRRDSGRPPQDEEK
jgi:hypothetical protein